MENNNNNIQETRTEVIVELVREGLKAAADTAQVRQSVTKTYPVVQSSTSLSKGLFAANLFGEGKTFTHDRVAFVDIPKGSSQEEAQAQLDNFPTACIYKIYSYDVRDVMTEGQKDALDSGFSQKTIAHYEEKFSIPDQDGNTVKEDGKVLYSSSHFMPEFKADVNLRVKAPTQEEGARVSIGENQNQTVEAEANAIAETM